MSIEGDGCIGVEFPKNREVVLESRCYLAHSLLVDREISLDVRLLPAQPEIGISLNENVCHRDGQFRHVQDFFCKIRLDEAANVNRNHHPPIGSEGKEGLGIHTYIEIFAMILDPHLIHCESHRVGGQPSGEE